jgi:hypothetical protein
VSKEVNMTDSEVQKGTSPENAYSLLEAIRDDFFGKGVANECWNSFMSSVAIRSRGETVQDTATASLRGGLALAWAGTGDAYDE